MTLRKQKKIKDVVILKRRIIKKFKTLEDFARVLGISPANLSNKLRRQSPEFMVTLEEHGIDISDAETETQPEGTSMDNLERLLKDLIYEHKINLQQIREDLERIKAELKRRGLL